MRSTTVMLRGSIRQRRSLLAGARQRPRWQTQVRRRRSRACWRNIPPRARAFRHRPPACRPAAIPPIGSRCRRRSLFMNRSGRHGGWQHLFAVFIRALEASRGDVLRSKSSARPASAPLRVAHAGHKWRSSPSANEQLSNRRRPGAVAFSAEGARQDRRQREQHEEQYSTHLPLFSSTSSTK